MSFYACEYVRICMYKLVCISSNSYVLSILFVRVYIRIFAWIYACTCVPCSSACVRVCARACRVHFVFFRVVMCFSQEITSWFAMLILVPRIRGTLLRLLQPNMISVRVLYCWNIWGCFFKCDSAWRISCHLPLSWNVGLQLCEWFVLSWLLRAPGEALLYRIVLVAGTLLTDFVTHVYVLFFLFVCTCCVCVCVCIYFCIGLVARLLARAQVHVCMRVCISSACTRFVCSSKSMHTRMWGFFFLAQDGCHPARYWCKDSWDAWTKHLLVLRGGWLPSCVITMPSLRGSMRCKYWCDVADALI